MADPVPRSSASKHKGKLDSRGSEHLSSISSHPTSSPTNPTHSEGCSYRSVSSIHSQQSPFSSKNSDTQSGSPIASSPVMCCGCNEPASIITSRTANNPGRKFLKCRKMIQAGNCTCYRRLKGCFLWIWEDCLEDYVKRKTEWIQEQCVNNIMQEYSQILELKDQEIRRISIELTNSIQAGIISTSSFKLQIKIINRSHRIYMFLAVVMFAWSLTSIM